MEGDSELARVRWRCRRGMLELDLFLERFVTQEYSGLAAGEKAALTRLLETPDTQLLDYLQGRQQPADPELAALVSRIR